MANHKFVLPLSGEAEERDAKPYRSNRPLRAM